MPFKLRLSFPEACYRLVSKSYWPSLHYLILFLDSLDLPTESNELRYDATILVVTAVIEADLIITSFPFQYFY